MMESAMRAILTLLLALPLCAADPAAVFTARRLAKDAPLNLDPASALWKEAGVIRMTHSARGEPAPGHETEVRARWTAGHLYFLFICPYERLHLKPDPETARETNKLWEFDVAEVFVGADFEKIWQYREYQVSPQGEWVDLDIDRKAPKPEGGWLWNSGFEVAARIEAGAKRWIGAMKIPIASITERKAGPGFEFRANIYRIQGPPPQRRFVAWRPTGPGGGHHVPESFGILKLGD
jgi:hypothetical protein